MNFKALLLTLVVFFAAEVSHAQMGRYYATNYRHFDEYGTKKKKWLKRQYISLGMAFMNMEYSGKYREHPYVGNYTDTAIYLNKASSSSYCFGVGSFANLARIQKKQMLAFDWSFGVHLYNFKLVDRDDPVDGKYTLNAATMMFEMPVGLSYRSGGEASLDPKDKMLFTAGVGFAPSVALTALISSTLLSAAGVQFKMRPYITADMGYFFGVAMKAKVTYYLTPLELMNKLDGDIHTGQSSLTLTGSSNFVVSLVILPFSFKWNEEDGY